MILDFKLSDGKWANRPYVDGRQQFTLSGVKWSNIINKCKIDGSIQRRDPSYIGCVNRFSDYQQFVEWHVSQIGYGNIDENGDTWHIDKDLLIKYNKIYSSDTCILLPRELNCLLEVHSINRGNYPIGVDYYKPNDMFRAAMKCGKTRKHIGYFSTPEEAFARYRVCKLEFIHKQAEKWKQKIDKRAYDALINYDISIID